VYFSQREAQVLTSSIQTSPSSIDCLLYPGNDKDRYEPVYAFGHLREKSDPVEFLVIHTFPYDKKRRPLEITGEHMVYLHGKQNPVRADSLRVGDVLRGDHYTGLTVTKIKKVKRRDQYAPLTPHGTLLVDGILASSYISLQEDAREHIELGENGFTVRISQRVMVHMFLSPLRMYCMGITTDFCQTYNEDGLPPYVDLGLQIADWGIRQNVFVQLVGLLVFFLVLSPPVLIEDLAGPELGPLMLLITIISLILYKRSNYRVRIKIRHHGQE
jgi:Hint module